MKYLDILLNNKLGQIKLRITAYILRMRDESPPMYESAFFKSKF